MVGQKPEHWRIITPIVGALAFISSVGSNIASWSVQHTIESIDKRMDGMQLSLDKHVDRINDKFDTVTQKQETLNSRLSMIQGQCCRKSFIDTQEIQSSIN